MQFGLFDIVRYPESTTEEQDLLEALEQIEYADQLGIENVWLGEHHFSRHGLLSGIFSFAGAVAARTKRMRIGTAVVVLPFHNPILVAEEAAMLDILTKGRFDLGVGSGYMRREFDGLGVDIDESRERFREGVDVITKAWTEETLTFHGKYTNVDDLWVIPKPVQKPHPPLYLAVSTSPASIEYAASRNMTIIVGGPTDILGQAPDVVRLWREKMEQYGHPHAHIDPPVSRGIYVAPTMEEAETDPIGRDDFSLKILAKIGSPIAKDGKIPKGYEDWKNRQFDREKVDSSPAALPPLYGTPDVLIERLTAIDELGIRNIFGTFGFPGLPHKKTMRSIELFTTKVRPHFQKAPAKVTSS